MRAGEVSLQVVAHAEDVAAHCARRLACVHLLVHPQGVEVAVRPAARVACAAAACWDDVAVSGRRTDSAERDESVG